MKKYLGVLLLLAFLVPGITLAQTSSTVSKVVNTVVKNFTPPVVNTPAADAPSPVLGKKKGYDPLIALVQARATNLGTYAGVVDGLNGPKTRAALAEIQQFFGLTPDGAYGPQTQRLFDLIPTNTSLRSTEPLVAIALKRYVREQMFPARVISPTSTQPTILATIPFTPNGVSQVLSEGLALTGFTQVSEAVISGTRISAKPQTKSNGATVALYTLVSAGGNTSAGSGSSLDKNYSTSGASATSVYVCEVIDRISTCVPVPFEIANAINSGTITLEQYLANKSANGDLCIQCFLDDQGNLGVITGGGSDPTLPPSGSTPPAAANVTSMCMDYPFANTNTASFEITFDKPMQVVNPGGLKLDVTRYFNASNRTIKASYVSSNYPSNTLRFTAPLSAGNSIYFEGEGMLNYTGGAKIVVAATGEQLDLHLLPDTFRLSNPCGTSSSYDVSGTKIVLSPTQLYEGEAFNSPRLNVEVSFNDPVTVSGNPRLIMNPSNSGSTATGFLVSGGSGSRTLVFHFNSSGTRWDNILGTFAFDHTSGSIKKGSGQNVLLNIPAGEDQTGGTCAVKRIGNVCVQWGDGVVNYTVSYTRDLEVRPNGSNSNIQLLIDPLNPTAQSIVATMTSYDTNNLYFTAPTHSSLLSDYTGQANLNFLNGATVRTINKTLQGLGHDEYGGYADPDLGIFSETCDGSTPPDSSVDMCANFSPGYTTYRLTYDKVVTVNNNGSNNNIKLIIHPISGGADVVANYAYQSADEKSLFFIAGGTGSTLNDYIGQASLAVTGGATISTTDGIVPSNLGNLSATCDAGWDGDYAGLIGIVDVEKTQEVVTGGHKLTVKLTFESSAGGDSNAYITGAPLIRLINPVLGASNPAGIGGALQLVSGAGTTVLTFEATRANPYDLNTFSNLDIVNGSVHTKMSDGSYGPANLSGLNL